MIDPRDWQIERPYDQAGIDRTRRLIEAVGLPDAHTRWRLTSIEGGDKTFTVEWTLTDELYTEMCRETS